MKRQTRLLLLTLGLLLGALAWQGTALDTQAARPWRTATHLASARTLAAPLATDIVVNATADGTLTVLATNTTCDLREAIAAANTNVAVGQCSAGMAGADTITFAPGVMGTITLTAGELIISEAATITGPGASLLTVSGNNASRVFNIAAGSFNVTLSALTIADGRVTDTTAQGGGILNNSSGALTINNSTLTRNNAAANNSSSGGTSVGSGGGIANAASGAVNVTGSTLTGNSARASSNAGQSVARGGGIFNNFGVVNVTNSTLTDNSASASSGSNNVASGGGILNNFGVVNVTNSTLTGNSATGSGMRGDGGGILNGSSGVVNIKNTIIAQNTATGDGQDVRGAFTSQGYNFISRGDDSTGFTNGVNNDQIGSRGMPLIPLLGPLQNNGGPTPTRLPLAGSPVIDKGATATDPVTGLPLTTDQRGFPRPVDDPAITNATGGDGSDIGASEVTCITITAQVSGGGTIRPGQTASVSVTVTGGTGPYTITLNNSITQTGSSPLSFTLGPQATTTYTVTAGTDANGCPVTPAGSATITVDSTPPTIACPPNQTSISAGTSVPVAYPAPTVSDDRQGASFSCTPASGATFPLGATTVNCTASDAVGNTAACSFTVTVLQPRAALKNLIRLIGNLELANSNLERGQTATACTNLQNYINQVNALVSAGQLTQAQGQALISYVNQIRNAVGCAGSPFAT